MAATAARRADLDAHNVTGGMTAWTREGLDTDVNGRTMIFRQLTHDDLGCASYLIGDENAGVAAVVDPKLDIDEYLRLAATSAIRIEHVWRPTTTPTTSPVTAASSPPPARPSTSTATPTRTTTTSRSTTAGS